MKAFRRKELRDVWGDESRMILCYRRIWESDPVLRALYRYLWGLAMADATGQPVAELGGGCGLIHEYYPEVITSDINPFPWTNLLCDATRLPFARGSVGSFIAVAFFHHCLNPRRFFEETRRALAPGGRLVIVDPYITPLSRLVYAFGTEEDLDLAEAPFESEDRSSRTPLLDANVARATIIFGRNRPLFEKTFPDFKVVRVDHINFLRHLAAGSFVQRSPFPAWCYPLAGFADRALHPFRHIMGMLMKVVIEKAS